MRSVVLGTIVFWSIVCYDYAMQRDFGLNSEQMLAVRDTEGQILVIAGAGSGKTRVLTARICGLVDSGVDPYNILAITFTNKAANEMKERIEQAMGDTYGILACTFHSLCARILRVDAESIGYGGNFTIYTETESERVVKRVCENVKGADAKRKNDYLRHISAAKTAALSPEAYYNEIRDFVTDADTVIGVYTAYERELRQSNAMDFDDLLVKTKELFDTCPDVLQRYSRRFRYINVDEFQDTNKLQYDLVKQLCSVWGNLFVVGDEDQSIYSWRGAEIRNILDFPKDFPSAKVYKLEQNYRSTTEILNAANNVIKNNSARNAKTLWSANKGGDSVEYYEAYGDRDEAGYVSRKINAMVAQGANYRDMAVLVRVNSLTRLFEEDFNLHGIPYKVFGGFRFFDRKEIKDALGYVRLALNPADNDSLLRVVNYPRRGIGQSAVTELATVAEREHMSFCDVLRRPELLSSANARKLGQFSQVAFDIEAAAKTKSPVDFMSYVIERSGLQNLKFSDDPEDVNRYENIEELVGAVNGFMEDNPEATIADFMQSVALVSDSDEMTDDNYVTLATVHAVKGLEFDNVFIVGLEEGVFPVSIAVNNGDVEEERRLMYVAITRARKRLFVISSRSRFRFGETVYNPKSRFIAEMRGDKPSIRVGGAYFDNQAAQRMKAIENLSRKAPQKAAPTQRKVTPAGSDASFDEFKKDVIVEHTKFGRGIIISTVGEGEDKTAAIAFKGLGVKRFSLAIAINSLKIVKE